MLRFLRDRRPSRPRRRDGAPVAAEALAVPAEHGLGLYDDQSAFPVRSDARKRDPELPIERRQPRSRVPPRVDGKLLSQGQLRDGLVVATPEEREEASDDRRQELQQRSHRECDAARFRGEKEA